MKTLKLIIALAFLGGTLLSVSSCGKYENGPGFTLLTKKARLTGDWDEKETVDVNGNVTADNSSDYATFEKDGTYKVTSGSFSFIGTWEFVSDKEKLRVTYTSGSSSISSEATIMRLTNKELWLKDDDGDVTKLEAR
jgi:hypothetical protein